VGDLVKDEYSKILLECLDEYSKSNEPQNIKFFRNIEIKDDKCGCNLFEYLDINELFRNGEINKNKRDMLLDSLFCYCKNKPLEPDLTEEQKQIKSKLKIKAESEIAEVLIAEVLSNIV